MVVGQCDAQFGRDLLQQGGRGGHHLGRTLVHSDVGDAEPSFFAEVTDEGGQERAPHFAEGRRARIGLDVDEFARHGILVVEHVVPRQHRIAVDVLADAQVEHEPHPAVEDREVILPRAVGQARPDDHIGVGVVALVVPGVLVERCRDDFLPGVCELPHRRPHPFEMLVAPDLYPFGAGHGRRMLPQVEVVGPLRGRGQGAFRDVQVQRQRFGDAFALYRNRSRVAAGGGVARDIYRDPDGTGRPGGHVA